MRSDFSAQTLAEIFRDIYLGERSGVLQLSKTGLEKRVFFDRGMILFAESSLPEEDLGPRLIQAGHLSVGALAEGRANVNGANTAQDLARVLVNRDLVGRGAISGAMREIVQQVVRSVFGWTEGNARFHEGLEAEAVFDTDILRTIGVILDGVLAMAGFEPIHEAMLGLDNRLRLRRPTPVPVHRLALSPTHGFVLSRVDGNMSLNDLISILPPGEEEPAVRFLFAMLILGILDYEPRLSDGPFKVADIVRDHADRQALERMQEQTIRKLYQRIREQNPYEILEIPNSASHGQIKQAYEQRKSSLSRERILPRVREKYRNEVTLLESRMLEAFLTLTQPKNSKGEEREAPQGVAVKDLNVRVEMDRTRSQVEVDKAAAIADGYYAKARRSMREGDYHNAIQYGKLAISHHPSDARYFCLLADCQSRNPEARWQRMAETNYAKATELDPWNADYWISLGRLYKRRGMNIRAKKQFEEALKLVPNKPEIIEELKSLD